MDMSNKFSGDVNIAGRRITLRNASSRKELITDFSGKYH